MRRGWRLGFPARGWRGRNSKLRPKLDCDGLEQALRKVPVVHSIVCQSSLIFRSKPQFEITHDGIKGIVVDVFELETELPNPEPLEVLRVDCFGWPEDSQNSRRRQIPSQMLREFHQLLGGCDRVLSGLHMVTVFRPPNGLTGYRVLLLGRGVC